MIATEIKLGEAALPPSDRTEEPQQDLALVKEFKEFIASIGLSQATAARKIGVDPSALSGWVTGNLKGRWQLVEAKVDDFVRTEPLRRHVSQEIFEHDTVEHMRRVVDDLLKTSHVAMYLGDSGVGKTSAILKMLEEHPLCVLVTAYTLGGAASAMLYRLKSSISMRGFGGWRKNNHGGTHLNYIIDHFKGSERLIIVDNCHRLTVTGIEFWFDFRDQTGCPVMFVGCQEFMDRMNKVRNNDQQLSRTGELWTVKMNGCERMAEGMLRKFMPAHVEELLPLAAKVAARPGHARTLFGRLELTRKALANSNGKADVCQLFEDSRSLLPARREAA
jgi:DNA transposition AAA+ family ATPase